MFLNFVNYREDSNYVPGAGRGEPEAAKYKINMEINTSCQRFSK